MTGAGDFAITFQWTNAEYSVYSRLSFERWALLRWMRRVSGTLALSVVVTVPALHYVAHVAWSPLIGVAIPWTLLFGFWYAIGRFRAVLPRRIMLHGRDNVPEERTITDDYLIADGPAESASMPWSAVDYVEETPDLIVIGRGKQVVGIPLRALQPAQLESLRQRVAHAIARPSTPRLRSSV